MEAPIETARARSPHAPALALLALAFALVAAALSPSPAQASAADRIHIVSISGSDAILIESDGVFGMVDSGEDNDYPSGDDPRYPSRPGIVAGEGFEDEVISYMRSVGVTQDNFEFYIGTHPHSDHIGSADEIIREFHPKRVYTPEYRDEFISDDRALWDNLYVYDNLIQAARDVGASLILNLDPNAPVAPNPEADLPTSPSVSNDDQGASAPDQAQEPLPEAEPMTAEEVARAFGVDPTDPANPNNPETLPHGYVMVPTSDDPNEVFNTDPDSATTGNPSFSLGSLTIEIMNYGDDYKYHPVPDANYFSWGVKVTAANGRSAFLAGDICNYNGDESRLAPRVGHVDLLKMAHHGFSGSNTPAYLETLHPSIAIQTADFEWLPMSVVDTLCSLGTRHYTTPEARERGIGAIVTTLSDSSVKVNVASDEVVYRTRESTPYLTAYANGLKTILNGWILFNERWYWFDGGSSAVEDRWLSYGGYWYYLGSSGSMVASDWASDGNHWWLLDEQGRMITTSGWQSVGGAWYWLNAGGAMASDEWVWDGRDWYRLAPDGAMQTGWYSDGSHWYYLDPGDGGRMKAGWLLLDGEWYHLASDGSMETGWLKEGSSWYHLASDGSMDVGWYSDGSRWYYLDPEDGGRMAEGWLSLDGEWYWLEPGHGGMASGEWVWDGWDWYHVASDGAMQTGWYSDGAYWYYLDPESGGRALDSGWHWLGDVDYKFSSSCRMVGAWVDVPCLMQYPELPTGCESVALTDLLLYYGYSPSKTTIASSYLPRSSTNFVTAFCGNPFSFGGNLNACCAPAIVIAGNAYLEDRGNHRVVEVTGSSRGDVLSYLQNGTPVQVWSTVDCVPSPGSWTSPQWHNGRKYQLFSGTHSVVVEGYDLEDGIVYVSDPISGSVTRSAFTFFSIYSHLGSQAVIVEEK